MHEQHHLPVAWMCQAELASFIPQRLALTCPGHSALTDNAMYYWFHICIIIISWPIGYRDDLVQPHSYPHESQHTLLLPLKHTYITTMQQEVRGFSLADCAANDVQPDSLKRYVHVYYTVRYPWLYSNHSIYIPCVHGTSQQGQPHVYLLNSLCPHWDSSSVQYIYYYANI